MNDRIEVGELFEDLLHTYGMNVSFLLTATVLQRAVEQLTRIADALEDSN